MAKEINGIQVVFVLGLMGGLLAAAHVSYLIAWSIWCASLFCELWPGLRSARAATALLANRFASFLGRISYPLYCCHLIVLHATSRVLLNIAEIESQTVFAALLFGIGAPFSIAVSYLIHRTVEEPAIRFGKAIVKRRSREKELVPAAPPDSTV